MKVLRIPNWELVLRMLPFVAIDLVLLAIWTAWSPPSFEADYSKALSTDYIENVYIPGEENRA